MTSNKKAYLLIHGLSGSAKDLLPLADYLHSEGHIAVKVDLVGHGSKPERLKGVKFDQWVSQTQTEVEVLLEEHQEVIVFGHSMGGLLALVLGAKNPKLHQIITLNISYRDFKVFEEVAINLSPILKYFKPWYHLTESNKVPLETLQEYKKLVKYTKSLISQIKQPTLIIQSTEDKIESISSSEQLNKDVANCELVKIDLSKHMPHNLEEWEEIFETLDQTYL